jgi:hypothetical protein
VITLLTQLAHGIHVWYCRERELAAVKVDAKDVEFIVMQLEVSKDAADRALREHLVREHAMCMRRATCMREG